MAALLSPGVAVIEKDFSSIVPASAIGTGVIAGRFTSGPIDVPVMITTEDQLYATFGAPNEVNYIEWFTAAQFLAYSQSCWVVRAKPAGVLNANAGGAGTVTILNNDSYYDPVSGFTPTMQTAAKEWAAKTPGTLGNNIAIITVDADSYGNFTTWADTNKALFPGSQSLAGYFGYTPGTTAFVSNVAADASENKKDELHILVIDVNGHITGTNWTVLEKYQGLSKCADAVDYKGNSIYYANVINQSSQYVWFSAHTASVTAGAHIHAWGTIASDISATTEIMAPIDVSVSWTANAATVHFEFLTMTGGVAGTTPADGDLEAAYNLFSNKDKYEANLFMTAAYSVAVVQSIVNNVVTRKDSMAFISPRTAGTAGPIFDSSTTPGQAIVTSIGTFNLAEQDSQYCVADTGWKYIFDRYNGKYRWIPMNGDIAGIIARNDTISNPWWSPGGFNRGGLKNVIKLAYNPSQADRDILYPKGINPVVAFPGQGVVLFGDRTMTQKPSAFDRINVRRLFIILEKSIAKAAKYQLFEFNDTFTRAAFKNMVDPFLRQIQGSRGITDFLVVCDTTNNTGQVIDSNQFVADIFVKPARSINFITLSFIATRTDVAFSTVVAG